MTTKFVVDMIYGLVTILPLCFLILAACLIEGKLLHSLSFKQRSEKTQQEIVRSAA